MPASYAQQRLWLVQQLDLGSPFYLVPMGLRMRGRLDVTALAAGLAHLIRRHESFRTSFAVVDGEVMQTVEDAVRVPLRIADLRALAPEARLAEAERVRATEARRPFDLGHGPLLRTTLIRLADDDHELVVVTHHIVIDAWSQGVFFRELGTLYDAISRGEDAALPEPRLQYADYAIWQRDQDPALAEHLSFWRERLAGAPMTELPFDRPRPPEPDHRGAEHRMSLPPDLVAALKRRAHDGQATLFMLLLTAFKVLLARSTGRPDVVIGSPVAGRGRSELDGLIGFFVNSLVLRTDLTGAGSFNDCLDRVRRTCLEAWEHQDVPFERLVEGLGADRDPGRNPYFQIMFVLQNAPGEQIAIGDLTLDYGLLPTGSAKFDLNVSLQEEPGEGIQCVFEYATQLFDPQTIGRLADRYLTLLRAVGDGADDDWRDLPALTDAETRLVGDIWNSTSRPVGEPPTLHGMLAEVAARHPDRVAVDDGEQRMTYGELDRRANRLAHHLRAMGVRMEEPVGVCTARTADLLVALYGVMKAGGAYVPLDPAYPRRRLAAMLDGSGVRVIVAHDELVGRLPADDLAVLRIDTQWPQIAARPETPPDVEVAGENLAYIIYTSGSTGVPKGAANEHRSLANLVAWGRGLFTDDELAGFAATCSIGFDFSVYELFIPLSLGGTVVLLRDILSVAAHTGRTPIRVLSTVPSAAAELVRSGGLPDSARVAVLGGELLTRELVAAVRENSRIERVINNYGVTEAAVTTANDFPLPGTGPVPIGAPICNTTTYVLDDRMRPVPIGAPGELYVGGVSLARCYVARADLTADRFVPEPFGGIPGGRLYRTGDLVRWSGRGRLEFLGRVDHQVKVHGLRIELGDVESEVRACPGVEETVVVVRTDDGDDRIVAYVTGADVDPERVRALLFARLPGYMVPAHVVVLAELPRNEHDKIDRAALPAPSAPKVLREVPGGRLRGDNERVIAEVWSSVLGVERIGRHDNFFELGGHSLLLVRVGVLLSARLGRQIALIDLFRHPTVATFADYLDDVPARRPLESAGRPAPAPASAGRPAPPPDGLAIIGMACRVPGADSVEALWRNLCDGLETISTLSDEDLAPAGLAPGELADPAYVRRAGTLPGIDLFDAEFFGFSPREAELMDPQHRVFLECSVEALQRAGFDPGGRTGAVGVYAGVGLSDYLWENMVPNGARLRREVDRLQLQISLDKDYIATRVAYKLNLCGPAVTVQTACSSSLVAVHMAARALLAGDCDVALAGGVSLMTPARGYRYQEGGILSRDGHCRAYDARATGTVPGSGVGVVVLKRLADALADGDPIAAVVLGSAINNDGADRVGYTAPSVEGQAAVVRAALREADVEPRTIGFVEGHGTATPIGDPIEVTALTEVYGPAERPWCALGSIKTNVGHLDCASGVAGLIKAVLAVQHGVVPPHPHFGEASPHIERDGNPFFVNAEPIDWPVREGPRRAAVSSFGLGGTNAHFVLEQPPEPGRTVTEGAPELIVLSARTRTALDRSAELLAERLINGTGDVDGGPREWLADVAYTLQVGRSGMTYRRFAVATDTEEAGSLLSGSARGATGDGECDEAAPPPRVVFGFGDGAGVNFATAGALLRDLPEYREHVEEAGASLDGAAAQALAELLAGRVPPEPVDPSVAEPVGLVVQTALTRLLSDWTSTAEEAIGLGTGRGLADRIAGGPPFAVPGSAGKEPRSRVEKELAALAMDPTVVLLDVSAGSALAEVATPILGADQVISVAGSHGRSGLLRAVGRLWARGVDIDWRALHREPRRRLVLPTYPFERQRYWIEPPVTGDDADSARPAGRRPDPADWFSTPSWRRAPLPGGKATPSATLVVAGDEGLGDRIAARLAASAPVTRVRAGRTFAETEAGVFTVDPAVPADLESVVRRMCDASGGFPARIVFCLAAVAEPPADRRLDAYYGLLHLARALVHTGVAGPVELTVVTAAAQAVAGEPDLVPEHAMLTGLCRVVPQELPQVTVRLVDVLLPPPGWRTDRLVGEIIEEITTNAGDPTVAYRDADRWVQEYAPMTPPARDDRSLLRADGVYLFIGMGAVGDALSAQLARQPGVRIAFAVRTPLPPRGSWDAWLAAHPDSDLISRRIGTVRELERAGAEVMVLTADVSDHASLEAAVDLVETAYGPINGVIHAAGTVAERLSLSIAEATPAGCAADLAGKVHGLPVLADVLRDRRPDFVLLCSSLSAILGGLGFAAYAAANSYVDLFAQRQRRTTETPWITVDWEGFLTAESATVDAERPLGESMAELALEPPEAQVVFDLLMRGSPPPQVVISTGDLAYRLRTWVRSEESGPADKVDRHPRPNLSTRYVAARTDAERIIAEVWCGLFGVEAVGVHDGFFELGGDSLLAIRLLARMQQRFDRALPLHTVVQAGTVARLAELVEGRATSGTAASVLVPLQQGTGDETYFWIHPLGGTVFCYTDLARELGPEVTSYGLQVPSLVDGLEAPVTLPAMADRYAEEIRAVQPDGPYRVGGWSAGGIIAVEVARRLAADGADVPVLATVDVGAPDPEHPPIFDYLEIFAGHLALLSGRNIDPRGVPPLPPGLDGAPLPERLDKVSRWARASGLLPDGADPEELAKLVIATRAVHDATAGYPMTPYEGPMWVIRAAVQPGRLTDDHLGWSRIAPKAVALEAPGDHRTVIQPPNVRELAALVSGIARAERLAG
jgi:amino acid adenylation domain-containing protein